MKHTREWQRRRVAGRRRDLACALILALAPAWPPVGAVQAAPSAHQRLSAAGWSWPLEPRPAVVRGFDLPAEPWLAGHRGVDLAAVGGQHIRAPSAGVVGFAGWVVDRPLLTVVHPDGVTSSFEPVQSTLKAGDRVVKGQDLGTLAPGGHCGATCLHWGVRNAADIYLDPLQFILDRRPSVLLPLPPEA
jgi:murein DD-endopeptidase MepM/ murein hydrolase activator NlpD